MAEWLELPREKEDFFSLTMLPDSPDDKNEISDSGDVFVALHIMTILKETQHIP